MLAVRTTQLTAEDLHLKRLAALSDAPGTYTLMKTELQSTRLCDLPEDLRPLSINGSHFDVRGVDHPAALRAAPEGLDTRGRASIMASATPFCFCTTQKHLAVKRSRSSMA